MTHKQSRQSGSVHSLDLSELKESYVDSTSLVTGGAGFIGSNLVRRLLELGAKRVVVLDDLSSAAVWNIPRDDRVKFVNGSILEIEALSRAFDFHPNYVFHLAAHFANQNSVEHPEFDLQVNGLGTLRVLRFAHNSNAKRLVYASSGCSVYGSDAPLPLEETHVSLHLDTPYQITKLIGELYCYYFHNYYGLEVSIPRFFNVFGPGEIPGRYRNVIPNFIFWALQREALPITGTGKETRDFTYVGDVVTGVLRCGFRKEALGEAINLASGQETAIIDLASMINQLTGNREGVIFKEKRDWDKASRRRASIEKARRLINYSPSKDMEPKLGLTVKWFRENWKLILNEAKF